jgi:hypothetical protein
MTDKIAKNVDTANIIAQCRQRKHLTEIKMMNLNDMLFFLLTELFPVQTEALMCGQPAPRPRSQSDLVTE